MKNVLKLISSVVGCMLIGSSGGIFTSMSVASWYPTLNKPFFNPPNWLFAPVWSSLFFLLGVALFLIWRQQHKISIKRALTAFTIQYLFNILWSAAFFGLQQPLIALIVIAILWFLILWTIIEFAKISKIAGWLLVPYILWVSFASILNAAIVYLN